MSYSTCLLRHSRRTPRAPSSRNCRCATATTALIGTILWELRHPAPIINLRLFRDRNFSAAAVCVFFAFGVLYGSNVLLPQLLLAAPARVIVVSSGGMYGQPLGRSVTPMKPADFRGITAYARAKRAQVALSAEWARRFPESDIAFHAMHPGWASTPGVAASLPTFRRLVGPILRTPAEGADTIVWLATARPEILGTGMFWHDRRPRAEYRLPRTGEACPGAARILWDRIESEVTA